MGAVEGIIFDWAGTTVDYGSFAPVQAFVEVFKHFGIEPTMEEVRKPMGMLKIDHIRTMLKMERIENCWKENYGRTPCDDDAKELYGHFEEKLFGILSRFATPKPGVVDVVRALKERGIAVGSTTGYTEKMMEIVTPLARDMGYAPDAMVTPDDVGGMGRPYPYMIFKNMELLKLGDVRKVIKVGDTISDIKEGKNAGVRSLGVVVGSSQMGLTQEEYENLSPREALEKCEKVRQEFLEAGADQVIMNMEELLELI